MTDMANYFYYHGKFDLKLLIITPHPHPIPLVKCECIYFCAKVRIWINLREKYGTKFGMLIYYKKNVDF